MEGVSRFCFAASYGVALGFEVAYLLRPRPVLRGISMAFAGAGLSAHTIYLLMQRPSFAMPYGSLLLLAWVLAVFGLYGALHHRRVAWGVFVLPVVLGLVLFAGGFTANEPQRSDLVERMWGAFHGTLVLLAAVGVSVGAVASVMYLIQARRLRAKSAPIQGIRLLSLERLEAMNRRAVITAFPLLTAGLCVGVALGFSRPSDTADWLSPKVLATIGLWLANAVLLVLRYSWHARGRLLAFGTLGAFLLLLGTLALSHPFVAGGGP